MAWCGQSLPLVHGRPRGTQMQKGERPKRGRRRKALAWHAACLGLTPSTTQGPRTVVDRSHQCQQQQDESVVLLEVADSKRARPSVPLLLTGQSPSSPWSRSPSSPPWPRGGDLWVSPFDLFWAAPGCGQESWWLLGDQIQLAAGKAESYQLHYPPALVSLTGNFKSQRSEIHTVGWHLLYTRAPGHCWE